MAVRDWATVDYYDVLGVRPGASDEEIARAYRQLAKVHHPDATGQEERDRFTEIAVAYEVLSNPRQRYDYDDVRASVVSTHERPVAVATLVATPPPLVRWTPRRATLAFVGGIVCFVAGVVFSIFTIGVQAHERADRAGRTKVVAAVTESATGAPEATFVTADGQTIVIPVPSRDNPGVLHTGDQLTLLYEPSRPTDVVVDETHFGRDFTYWFIAVKLLVCGPIVAWFGARKRRALARARV